MFKRLTDIVISLVGLALAAPLMLFVALAVALTDGTPVFFRQQRVGRWGAEFTLIKFRTMSVNSTAGKGAFDAGNTSRVTRLGAFLRYWKLDELPQLWNVLVGDMSLVGPRPEVRCWVDRYPQQWSVVHQIRPGITDPASIAFRHEEALLAEAPDPQKMYAETILPAKLSIYQSYVEQASVSGDAKILLNTFAAIVKPRSKAA